MSSSREIVIAFLKGTLDREQATVQLQALMTRDPLSARDLVAAIQEFAATSALPREVAREWLALFSDAGGTLVRRERSDTVIQPQRSPLPPPIPPTRRAEDRTRALPDARAEQIGIPSPQSAEDLRPGCVINDRFVLEKVLGKGGMGVVFGAIDRRKEEAQDPNPHIAIKVLSADFQRHPHSFVALQREARKAQNLAHPNVATVFDFDRQGDIVYMTMELLKGRGLDALVRETRGTGIDSQTALAIIRGIAEGLAYAHRKGIVHSDLKPGNIFVCEDGTPKILDFGIARAVPSDTAQPDIFDAGSLGAYTEAYATDEMVEASSPHPADDMYALGIIAYELLTGTHPYQRHSAPSARKLGMKPEPLRGLKRRQARAIERCLSFDRTQRPQDAAEFLKAFRGVTALQRASLAATLVLALGVGYLSYENYRAASPAIAFEDLPVASQSAFREKMAQGDAAWAFYERDGIADALNSALSFYVEAYDIHPRNRQAVAALNRVADALLAAAHSDPVRRREFARNLQQQSDHFHKYAPVVEAAK